ncbi:MAG: molecular chaperone DnaJ, partial [Anaerolineae bacterium]|nr:molecular chaperone DnaJ [Anaerolineae bacterium]
ISVNTCPRCQGRGEIITDPCENCNGSGRQRANRTLTVDVPAGVDDGMRIRYQGEGEPGENGGPPGNLYVTIHVRPHKYFQRRRDDILLEVTVNVAQAALGSTITVPTVEGEDALDIPAGTQTGESFRLRGKGFPRLRKDGSNAGRGDQWVVVQVAIPKKLNERQRELFEELADTLDTDLIRPSQKGFFERVLNFFSGEG